MNEQAAPNLTEFSDEDLWRLREMEREQENYHKDNRHAAEKTIYARMMERGAKAMPVGDHLVRWQEAGGSWQYDTAKVERILLPLIEEKEAGAIWNGPQGASHSYKIPAALGRKLEELGNDMRGALDACRMGRSGSDSLKGPTLEDMGEPPDGAYSGDIETTAEDRSAEDQEVPLI